MILNLAVVLALWATGRIGDPGMHALLALSNGIGAIFNAALLYRGLVRSGVIVPQPGRRKFLLKVTVASGLMAAFLWWFGGDVAQWLATSTSRRIAWLAAIVGGGAAVYFLGLAAMGIRPRQFRLNAAH
jgi:putative peptidoglycan lipid II flippase